MKKALMMAHVASMIDLFNRENIRILKELGYEVHVACNFESGSVTSKERIEKFYKELQAENITCHQLDIPRKLTSIGKIVKSLKQLQYIIDINEYDIIHCQAPISGVIARVASIKARKKGARVIYAAHGFHFFKGAPLKNWLLFYPIEKICSNFTDTIITINKEDYYRAKKFYKRPENRVQYIPGVGVDTLKYKHCTVDKVQKLKELGLPLDSKIVLTVGELVKGKNHKVSLEAFARADISNCVYLICGIGKNINKLKKISNKLGIEQKVYFLGYRQDIDEINYISDVFIFPSLREGLPVSVMEAMASGKPVICSDIRGNRDLIIDSKGGYLVKDNNIMLYKQKLSELIKNDNQRKEMGEFNRKHIMSYDIHNINNRMREIYNSFSEK